MNKKYLLLLFLAFSMSAQMFGQQDPYYSHFFLNKLAYNGASAGSNNAICASLLGHRQWGTLTNEDEQKYYTNTGLERKPIGPTTLAFNISSPVKIGKDKNQIGAAGLSVVSDRVGYESSLNINLSLAYLIPMPNGQKLQIGLSPGVLQKGYDDRYYNPLQPNDPLIPSGSTSERKFDLGAGVYYMNSSFHNLYVGLSATHLNSPSFTYATTGSLVTIQAKSHMYLVAGADFYLGSGGTILQPNLWVKKDQASVQFDVNARFIMQQQIVAGIGYRNGGANKVLETFSPQFGYYINPQFYIGYSYDIPLIKSIAKAGTHEIVATYCFKLPIPIPTSKYPPITPRFLGGYK